MNQCFWRILLLIALPASLLEGRIHDRANKDTDLLTCPPEKHLDYTSNFDLLYRLANLVVVGRVTDIQKHPRQPGEYTTALEVLCFLKGHTFRHKLTVHKWGATRDYCPEGYAEVEESQEAYLFFLRSSKEAGVYNILPHGVLYYNYLADVTLLQFCNISLYHPLSSATASEDSTGIACPAAAKPQAVASLTKSPSYNCRYQSSKLLREIRKTYQFTDGVPVVEKRRPPAISRQKLRRSQLEGVGGSGGGAGCPVALVSLVTMSVLAVLTLRSLFTGSF